MRGESRKKAIAGLASLVAFLSIAPLFAKTVELTILQSTDLHGSPAVAKFARWIAEERKADPELLLVDCGDLCNGTFAAYCDGKHMKLRAIAGRADVARKDLDLNIRSVVRAYFLRNWPARKFARLWPSGLDAGKRSNNRDTPSGKHGILFTHQKSSWRTAS